MPGHYDGDRLRHTGIEQVDGYRFALGHDQRRSRILGQPVAIAGRMGRVRTRIDITKTPHMQAGALGQVDIERKRVQVEGRAGDAANIVRGLGLAEGQSQGNQSQYEDACYTPELLGYICHCSLSPCQARP